MADSPTGAWSGSGTAAPNSMEYLATLPTLVNGQTGPLLSNSNEELLVTLGSLVFGEDYVNNVLGVITKSTTSTMYSPTPFNNWPLVNGVATLQIAGVIKASAGNLKSLYATNDNSSIRYFQLFNLGAAPVTAVTVPLFTFEMAASDATPLKLGTEFFTDTAVFNQGVAYGFSTTKLVYTAATATDHTLQGWCF